MKRQFLEKVKISWFPSSLLYIYILYQVWIIIDTEGKGCDIYLNFKISIAKKNEKRENLSIIIHASKGYK
jgi:hypothetical protein